MSFFFFFFYRPVTRARNVSLSLSRGQSVSKKKVTFAELYHTHKFVQLTFIIINCLSCAVSRITRIRYPN